MNELLQLICSPFLASVSMADLHLCMFLIFMQTPLFPKLLQNKESHPLYRCSVIGKHLALPKNYLVGSSTHSRVAMWSDVSCVWNGNMLNLFSYVTVPSCITQECESPSDSGAVKSDHRRSRFSEQTLQPRLSRMTAGLHTEPLCVGVCMCVCG